MKYLTCKETNLTKYDNLISVSLILECRMEKLLVVLLVASATVCFLTNLLVLIILTKRRKRKSISSSIKSGAQNTGMNDSYTRWNPEDTFRYQIVTSHCLAGIVASSVVIYPLKVWYFLFKKWLIITIAYLLYIKISYCTHDIIIYVFYVLFLQILSLVLSRSDIAFHHQSIPRPQVRHTSGQLVENRSDETGHFGFLTSQTMQEKNKQAKQLVAAANSQIEEKEAELRRAQEENQRSNAYFLIHRKYSEVSEIFLGL